MRNRKRSLSLLAFYLLAANITNLIFLVAVWLVATILSISIEVEAQSIIFGFLAFLVLLGFILGCVAFLSRRETQADKVMWVQMMGLLYWSFYGLIIGVLFGLKIGKGLSAIVGENAAIWIGVIIALAITILGRRLQIGTKIGTAIGSFLANYISGNGSQAG